MVEYSGPWSASDVAAFLDRTLVPLRLACHTPASRLWLVALWYRFRDGTFECATASDAATVEFLRRDPAVAFDVSTNDPPYRGIRGNGTATVQPDEGKRVLRALLERYLGGTDSALADRLLAPERDEVAIRIEPARVMSWDFTGRMPATSGVEG